MDGFKVNVIGTLAKYAKESKILGNLITVSGAKEIVKKLTGFITMFIVYTAVKTLALTVIKAILVPFIGPFAWLVSLLLDVGLLWIEWFIDLKEKIADFVEWILKNNYNNVLKMMKAINQKM